MTLFSFYIIALNLLSVATLFAAGCSATLV